MMGMWILPIGILESKGTFCFTWDDTDKGSRNQLFTSVDDTAALFFEDCANNPSGCAMAHDNATGRPELEEQFTQLLAYLE